MHIAPERSEFDPPPQRGTGRAIGLAVLAHLVLIGAVTWGVNWREDPTRLAAEAEIWSPTVQQAAPRAVEPPPPPPPPPAPPAPPAPPPPRVQPAPPPPAPKEADIAIQREKERQEKKRQQEEAERERQRKLEAEKAEARKKELAEKQLAEKQRLEEQKKRELAEKQKEKEKAQKLAQEKREREEREAERVAKLRDENLRRIQGMAGATGGPSATGNAPRSSGPSDSYAGRIRARVRPNIVFTDDVPGNPTTLVEVRLAPDGTITARRILRSSGSKSWDDAVLRALDRTEVLPRDVDGRVPGSLEMSFRPKD